MKKVLLLLALLAAPASAQQYDVYWQHPAYDNYVTKHKDHQRIIDWKFVTVGLAFGAAIGADIDTTVNVFSRCAGCVEGGNIFFRGKRPRLRSFIIVGTAEWAGVMTAAYYIRRGLKDEPAWFRDTAAFLLPIGLTVGHAIAARDNARIPADASQN